MEAHAVQINGLGHYTLTHQKVHPSTIEYFTKKIDATDEKLIHLLHEIDQEQISKTFNPKSDIIRPSEFFKKYYTPELHKEKIRPYIDKILIEALDNLRDKNIFMEGKEKNPTSKKLLMATEKCKVLFHFRREQERVKYFPTFKYKEQKIEFTNRGSKLLTMKKAWLLNNGILYDFHKNVEGFKLLPFLEKRFIEIPKSTENAYYEKFVVPLVEKYDIYAIGFDIVTEMMLATALVKVQEEEDNKYSIGLYFKYGNKIFPYEKDKKLSVILENHQSKYTFKRLRRSTEWEDKKRNVLEQNGLQVIHENSFVFPDSPSSFIGCLQWLSYHKNILKNSDIDVENIEGYCIENSEFTIHISDEKDWFDIKAVLIYGEYKIPFEKIKTHIIQGNREYILPNGLVAILPEELFTKYLEWVENALPLDGLKLHKHHWKLIEEEMSDEAFAEKYKIENKEFELVLSDTFNGKLRNYQEDALHWMYTLNQNHFGACLADDMGLGKTVVTSALLSCEKDNFRKLQNEELLEEEETVWINEKNEDNKQLHQLPLFEEAVLIETPKPNKIVPKNTSLILMPTSLIHNWEIELKKFVPSLKVHVHTGTNRQKDVSLFLHYDVILSTYGVVRIDIDMMQKFKFNYIILDESQVIKNPASLTARALSELRSKHKLVLTGTPIENGIADLWSQFNFINPGLLGSLAYFQQKYILPIEKQHNEDARIQLQKIISPFLLRRTKAQVAKELPEKTEHIYYCNMTEEQEKLYEETKSFYRNSILKSVSEFGLNKSKLHILKGLMMLRQIANHPALLKQDYLGESGKFVEINRKLKTALKEGHKILMFSQFVKQLHLFKKHFEEENIPYFYIDGTLTSNARAAQVAAFKKFDEPCVFLISLRAGGLGLNLTEADYVFIVDPWWNPAVEQQAQDRAHRIGQKNKVFAYKFITKNSVEEKILLLQKRKMDLAGSLISENGSFLTGIDEDQIKEIFE